jgi:Trm5-related predicted tRNA methylase
MLKQEADGNNVHLDPENRYIIVDAFLSFIAEQHDEEISFLKQQIKDGGFGFA